MKDAFEEGLFFGWFAETPLKKRVEISRFYTHGASLKKGGRSEGMRKEWRRQIRISCALCVSVLE